MKNRAIKLILVSLLVGGAWYLGRFTMRQEIALTTFMDQTVYLGYIQKNDIKSATDLIRVSNDTLLLELISRSNLPFKKDIRNKWLKIYGAQRASLPGLPDALFDPEQDKKVREVLEKFEQPEKVK